MRIGLFTDGLGHLDRVAAFAWCADHAITDVELGVGGWSPRPHADLTELLASPAARDRLLGEAREHGLEIAAINAAGNVLHPDPATRATHEGALHGAIELADLLDVDTVVTMSGCPGPRGLDGPGQIGVFAVWSVVPDDEPLYRHHFDAIVGPFWAQLSKDTARDHPRVRICLELHPGVTIYSADTFAELAAVTGPNVAVNLDPSHFWWQGVDPVRVIEAVGDRVGFAHGKDTTLYPDRIALRGVLDARHPIDPATAPWHFSAVGDGHGIEEWRRIIQALRAAGYEGTISIEHEDPIRSPEDAIAVSAKALSTAIGQ